MEIFKLFGTILVDSSKAEESISKTENKAEGLGSKLGSGIKTAAKWAVGLGAAAVAVGGAMMGAANKVAGTADEIDKASRRAGTSAETWQKLNYAFGQSGIESTKLEAAMIKNQKALNDAAGGGKKAVAAYDQLKVSIHNADGSLRNADEVFQDTLKSLANMEDKNLRNAIANDIFGKSYGDLAPILDSGSKGINDLTTRAEKLGLIMSQEAVDAGVKFGDTLSDVKQMGGALFNELAVHLIPVLQKMLDWIIEHMPEIKATMSVAFGVINVAVTAVSKLFDALFPILETLYNFIKPTFPLIADITKAAFETVVKVIEGVAGAFEFVTGAIKTALDWLGIWNKEPVEDKEPKVPPSNRRVNRAELDGSHAAGLAYVPFDGYVAELHKGERVVPANQNMQSTTVNHTGTIRVEGVNNEGQFVAVYNMLVNDVRQGNRRLPDKPSLIPI
jgi:hypothetical protein